VSTATVKPSSEGQILIPREVRDELHWDAGAELTLVTTGDGVLLKAKPKKGKLRLEDLRGFLRHDGPPVSIEELCKPVDYSKDWEESEKRSR